MNLSINSVGLKAYPKVLSKSAMLKNGATVNLEIVSKAPKTYDLKSSSYLGDKFKSAYGELVNDADRFDLLSNTFVEKMSEKTGDKDFLKEISDYFVSISK
jgi:hypothetical protein